MRIRKSQVLFPSSSLSDPHLMNGSPVVVQLGDAAPTAPKSSVLQQQHAIAAAAPSSSDRYQPSDQPFPPIGKPSNGSDNPSGIVESGAHRQHNKQDPLDEDVRRQDIGDSGEKGNHTRKGSIFGLEIQAEVLPQSSTSSTQDERWCEREKAIPLKKRRGSFENGITLGNNKKMKPKMKTKMNKKCSTQNDDKMEQEDEDDKKEEVHETKTNLNVSKKRARGSALMEGSRCSRVNGRGWRCCQQTLVGYSLCEHHLGKGRLRSMTSVRSRSIATSTAPKKVLDASLFLSVSGASSSSLEKQNKSVNDTVDNDEKKPVIITKKRMKLGMVKARSISSLLGQPNTHVAVSEENNN